jgi:hypothetical protein
MIERLTSATQRAWDYLRHNPVKLAIGVIVVCVVSFAYLDERDRREGAEAELIHQLRINDSTTATVAAVKADRDAFEGLYLAAKVLNGSLVAGVTLHVPKRDTTITHTTLPETHTPAALPDGTTVERRTATVHDSTFAGTLDGTITVDPLPGGIGFQYTFTRPAFNPSIGFVQKGDRMVAVAVWQNEQVEVEHPFWRAPMPPKRVAAFIGAGKDLGGLWYGEVGGRMRLPQQLTGLVSAELGIGTLKTTQLRVRAGVRKEF